MPDPYPNEGGAVSVSRDASYDATPERDVSQASVGELIGEVTADLSTLMRKELELAKAEMKVEATKAGKGLGMLGGAGYAGHMTALFLSFTLAYILMDAFDSIKLGMFVVALIWAIAAAILYTKGRAQMKQVNPKPEQTVETLKEDVQWAKTRTQ